MKVNPISTNALNSYKKQQRNVNAAKDKFTFVDRLEISDAAKEMQGVSDYRTERAEKVQKLKQEIQTGQYKVDARKVAEDMLKFYRF